MGLIAGAAIVAAGAVTAAGISYAGSEQARKSQGAAAARAAKKERKASKKQQAAAAQLEGELAQIQAPQWDLGADIADAERITGYNQAQLERLYPGARNQTELASRAITDYMRGVVPQDVQEQTMRAVAERGGAGFNIATAGMGGIPGVATSPQFDFARKLGLTSLQLQQYGMGASRDWQSLAGAFIESPLQVGQARLGFQKAASDLEMAKASARYGARAGIADWQLNMAQGQYGREMEGIATRLAATQQAASAVQGATQAIGTGYMSYAAAGQTPGVQTYGSVGAVQEAAPHATGATRMGVGSYVPRAQAVNPAIEAKYSVYR